jgi:AraC-like DNA-binding protein
VPEALLRQRWSAADPEAATAALRAVLGNGAVEAGEGPFVWDQVSAVDDGVSVTRIRSSGSGVRVRTGDSPELVVVAVREGQAGLADGDRGIRLEAGDLGLVPLDRAVELVWDAAVLDAFSIGSSAVQRLLGVDGRPVRLVAPRMTPRTRELAVLWDRLARVLAGTVLEAPDLYERDLVRDQMIDTLAATTIEAFELSDAGETDVDADDDALRRAEAYMRGRLGDPLSIPDIATASGVSLRGLQLLYQRRLGSTPLLHLRSLRLEAARAALERSAERQTVSGVARRFGYTNVGRFSAHYRAAYDETPSTTLERARSGGAAGD